MRIAKYDQVRHIKLPIYGAAADIKSGALLKRGVTPATDNGMLIKASGTSAIPDAVGILNKMLDYSVDGETLMNGTAFVTKDVELLVPTRLIAVEYDLSSMVTCTEAVNSTAMTVTSLEDNIDGAFLFVAEGTGIGQTNYLTASASGSCTLKAVFGTSLDTSSKFIKILPRFHQVVGLNSDGTKLSSQAAAGSVDAMIIDNQIEYSGASVQLDPTKHAALTGLGTVGVKFTALMVFRNTAIYTTD